MNFNERLTELRLARNISQAELAKKLGLSKSTISMYEQGRREPSFEIEELLADFFNVDLDYLRGKAEVTTQIVDSDISSPSTRIKKVFLWPSSRKANISIC